MADKFTPPQNALPDLSEYDDLVSIDWDEVRSLADEQGWAWDDEKGIYLDKNNNPVPLSDVLTLTYEELERIQADVANAIEQLEQSEDVAEWERTIAKIAVAAAALFFLLGIGNRSNITPEHREYVSNRLLAQFEFLRQFSQGILAGEMALSGIKARANLYPQDDQLLYSEAQEFLHSTEEWPFYQSILGGCNHCPECPEEAAKGVVERGTLIPIGSRLCRWNCCCMFEYHKAPPADTNAVIRRLTSSSFGWAGETKLTLPVTLPLS